MHSGHLLFLHFMKTGGTSFYRFLENNYPVGDYIPDVDLPHFQKVERSSTYLQRADRHHNAELTREIGHLARYKLITKLHFSYRLIGDFKAFYPDTKVVALFRDPIARIVSQIEHWRRTPPEHMVGLPPHAVNMIVEAKERPLEDFIRFGSESIVQLYLENHQAKMLAGFQSIPPEDEVILETALRNLEDIDLVGLTDNIEKFSEIVSFNLGFYNNYNEERLNVTPSKDRISTEQRRMIGEILAERNALDFIVLREARRRFDHLVQEYHSALFCLRGGRQLRMLSSGETFNFAMDGVLTGEGWHERENGIDGCARWGGPGTSSVLYLDVALTGHVEIAFNLVSVINDEVYSSMQIFVNGTYAPHRSSIESGFLLASIDLKLPEQSPMGTRIEFRFSKSMSAFEAHGVSDHRRKTVALQNMKIRKLN